MRAFFVLLSILSATAFGAPKTELRSNESLQIETDENLNPIGYAISYSNGEVSAKTPIAVDAMGPYLLERVNSAYSVLASLRELRALEETFPMQSFNSKKYISERTKALAEMFAGTLALPKNLVMSQIWIRGESSLEPFRQFYRPELFRVYHLVRKNLVQPSGGGYLKAILAATADHSAKEIFWETLAQKLINAPPGLYNESDDLKIEYLRGIIETASDSNFHGLFSDKSCPFALGRLRSLDSTELSGTRF